MEYPLSLQQKRIWSLGRLDPEGPPFAQSPSYRIAGPLDADAIEHALTEIVRRHSVLRSRILEKNGEPVQVPDGVVPTLQRADLTGAPQSELERRISELHDRLILRPFDFERGELMRALLVRAAPDDHALLIACAYLAFDESSGAMFANELAALYEARLFGRPAAVPELTLQFGEWAKEQRAAIERGDLESRVEHWVERLSPPPAPLPLSASPIAPRGRFGRSSETFPNAVVDRLQATARSAKATPFMLLLAAFEVLVHRATERTDICTFTSVPHRPDRALEPLIGLFGNLVALRTDLGGDPSFRELLDRVRRTVLDGLAHHDVPFDLVVDRLARRHGPRAMLRPQLFFVLFEESEPMQAGGAVFHPLHEHADRASYDLALVARLRREGLLSTLYYREELEEVGRSLARSLAELVQVLLETPEIRLSELSRVRVPTLRMEPEPARAIVGPRDDAEAELARLWAKVLGVESVGVTENFFALGGDSILAIRLFEEIERAYGCRVMLPDFMRAATVEKLARLIRERFKG